MSSDRDRTDPTPAVTERPARNGDDPAPEIRAPRESFEGVYQAIAIADQARRFDDAKRLQLLSRLEHGIDVLNAFTRSAGPKIEGLSVKVVDLSRDTQAIMHLVKIQTDQLLACTRGIGELSEQVGSMLRAIAENHDRSVATDTRLAHVAEQTDKSVAALWKTAEEHRHALQRAKEQVEAIEFDDFESISKVQHLAGLQPISQVIDAKITKAELDRRDKELDSIRSIHRARRGAVYAAIGSFVAGLILALVLRWLALGGK